MTSIVYHLFGATLVEVHSTFVEAWTRACELPAGSVETVRPANVIEELHLIAAGGA